MTSSSPTAGITTRVVATAGHVDHGKSSLVLALTGTDPDRFAEEKRRGLTIDLGFATTQLTDTTRVSFVDVPGHTRFLKNMLAGVGAVDACLFVVAATEGWKPQSEEHLRILEMLGLAHGVVALTKIDLLDEDDRDVAVLDVLDHLAGSFLADAPVVPVSSLTGEGLDELRRCLTSLVRSPVDAPTGRSRLWVDRVFAARGSGTVVTGTLTGGSLRIDDQVVVGAAQRTARVRGLQSHGSSHDEIGPGHRVAVNLVGIDHELIARGDAVTHVGRWHMTRTVDAELTVLTNLEHDVSRRGAWLAYIGSGELPVRLRVLGNDTIAPGASSAVRLHLPHVLPLLPGDRFVLRDAGRGETVGGGQILDVDPIRPASSAAPDRTWQRVVTERGWIEADRLEQLTGVRVEPTVGRWVATDEALTACRAAIDAALDAASELGLDIATLDERQRTVLAQMDGLETGAGRVRRVGSRDPLADHPAVRLLADAGCAPPDLTLPRAEIRELVRRGLLVERDGICFHPSAIETASLAAATLLAGQPDGFTVAQLRDTLGVTRKHAVPLASELDARGVTRRRGDLRIAGPRLPTTG